MQADTHNSLIHAASVAWTILFLADIADSTRHLTLRRELMCTIQCQRFTHVLCATLHLQQPGGIVNQR